MPSGVQQTDLFGPIGSSEDSHAKTCQWLDSVLAYLEAEADCGASSDVSLLCSVPVGFSSKTSMDFGRVIEGEIWEPSFGRWGTWGMGGPTACLTLNGSAWPKDASVCSLSDVLEVGAVPQKYFLSPTACRGILRRADLREKSLPPVLRLALTQAATTDRTIAKMGD